ncbi:substrate-binding periplasmic protein [Tateyamaria sp. SN6-1]|uniref:substrate-binding periplasmic protein n=1 Tax=Tateyamaria sp. SN6-1 TaxID=3092148 RepID=UPI0039F4F1B3
MILSVSAWIGTAAAQDAPLVAVADESPPFSGAALPGQGMSLDVIRTVLTEAGHPVETRVVPWARIMGDIKIGRFQIIGSLFRDPELEDALLYADPFYVTDIQLVQRRGAGHSFTTVEALRPFAIAVGDGFLYEDEFDHADYLKKIVVTTTLQAIRMVAVGRADLTLDSVDVIRHAITHQDPSLRTQVSFAPGVLQQQSIHMAIRRDVEGAAQIVADFNATLAAMRADGRLDRLLERHVLQ